MCLTSVTKRYAKPTKRERWAWKVLEPRLDGGYMTPYRGTRIGVGTWMKARTSIVSAYDGAQYEAGFHVYVRRVDAERMAWYGEVVKVKVRGVLVEGMDRHGWSNRTLVAREMYVPKQAGGAI